MQRQLSLEHLQELRSLADKGAEASKLLADECGELARQAGRQLQGNDAGDGSPLSVFHRHLLEKAVAWLESGMNPLCLLLDPRDAVHGDWWRTNQQLQNPSRPVSLFIDASFSLHPKKKYTGYVYSRTVCDDCLTVYKLENVGICPMCFRVRCGRCAQTKEPLRQCSCGAELV